MMIGASKDTVVSWETRRNRLSPQFARRIEFATGAEARSLLRRRGRLMGRGFGGHLLPYTRELYESHLRTGVGGVGRGQCTHTGEELQ